MESGSQELSNIIRSDTETREAPARRRARFRRPLVRHSLWLPLAQQGTSGVWAVRNAILKLIFYRLYVL